MELSLKMRCGSRLEGIWEVAHSRCVSGYVTLKTPTHPKTPAFSSIFEASGTYSNLWIALHHFKEQIPNIEAHTWRYIFTH